jgi:mannose-1-phosphate guanylyltransferase
MPYAVIMAGGGGTRLWPASRRKRPKQFLPLGARPGESLLAATARRLAPLAADKQLLVVTAAEQAAEVRKALPQLPAANVLAEPVARNTAAAIGLAAVHLHHRDPGAVMAALPADQHVGDEARFLEVVGRAFELAAARDSIVTIGITPTRPETGFGYLAPGAGGTVARFVEKPDAAAAERYVAEGYLWNAGMFFFPVRRILDEIARHLPALHAGLQEIGAALASGGDASAVTARVYPTLPKISIDHGIMEKAQGLLMLSGDFGWNDVGSWTALADVRVADGAGNVTQGEIALHDARRNIAVADPGVTVALVGVEDLIVVQSGNAVLVMPRSRAQDVREIVQQLEARGAGTYL